MIIKSEKQYGKILVDCINKAQNNSYKSNDVSDLLRTSYYRAIRNIPGVSKIALYPYSILVKHKPEIIRKFVKDKGFIYAQGLAIYLRGLINLVKSENLNYEVSDLKKIVEMLVESRSPLTKHYGWGQPFDWYSRKILPKNTPRATVSSQVGWAMLDMFNLTNDEYYLDIAKDIALMFIKEFNYTSDENGNFCLSYTTLDNYHIHNASMLAASLISRVSSILELEYLRDFGDKLVNFTVSHQNEDGSFYYWAPPDKLNYIIDNYHTGFVLESLITICQDTSNVRYKKALEDGMKFYATNLIDKNIPKYRPDTTYPIDIQSCAQSIITLMMYDKDPKYRQQADEIAKFTIDNFYIPEKHHFGYRLYEKKLDKSYYFRWGDAWMIRGLSLVINS